ncbi:MAG TPA: hypothetical protein VH231_17460 [Solirubrobacteraceae bacterium]|jgi:hypothetical protein|nr:hypothetical protein [Solirubrobacteraceae bacterium]
MANDTARISIGFQGGQALGVRVTAEALKDLRQALGARPMGEDKGFYDLQVEDGAVALNLDQIVYVHTDSGQHRVGFGL